MKQCNNEKIKNNKIMKIKKKFNQLLMLTTATLLVFAIINLLFPEISFARPGGGQSYSGGGGGGGGSSFSGGSGGGGGGGSSLGETLFFMGIIFIVFIIRQIKIKRQGGVRIVSNAQVQNMRVKSKQIDQHIENFKKTDPNFSRVLFLDFASSILTKFYSLNGKKEIFNLSPYIPKKILTDFGNSKFDIFDIVIGSVNINSIKEVDNQVHINVDFDFNYTLTNEGENTRFLSNERWTFIRKKGVLSSEPEKMRELSCPNCGSSLHFSDAGKCESCGSFVELGTKQWAVKTFYNQRRETVSTTGLAHYSQEMGTIEASIAQFGIGLKIETFAKKNNTNSKEWRKKFGEKTIEPYFKKMYEAWSNNKLDSIRNILTDRLYDSWMFWIDNYTKAGLRNKLDKLEISKIEFIKIEEDKFYESVTVRIYASCLDYVTDNDGKVKGGSIKKPRKFTEYWTFIRRNGVTNDEYDLSTCPNCGAQADKIGQAGVCEYCDTKISNGDFSWVLAVITQDEVYKG